MTTRPDPQDLAVHTRYLTAYAARAVGDRDLAQDLVQDTLVAALSAEAGFAGRSALRTWLVGILKHKIMDAYRDRARAPASLDELEKHLREVIEMLLEDGDPKLESEFVGLQTIRVA